MSAPSSRSSVMSDTTTETTMDDYPSARSSLQPCAACHNNPENANRLLDLENEVRMLRDKATAAADKLADYDEEIQYLKGIRNDSPVNEPSDTASDSRSRQGSTSRFSFLSSRKPLPAPPSRKGSLVELEAALARETHLREEAEKKVAQVNNEIEDLSATLFEQANEMVATERKARAALEERVATLQQRDEQRAKRLERIDEAMKRLERVKAMLAP